MALEAKLQSYYFHPNEFAKFWASIFDEFVSSYKLFITYKKIDFVKFFADFQK